MKPYIAGALLGMAIMTFICVVCPPAPLLTYSQHNDYWIDVDIVSANAGSVCTAQDKSGGIYFLQQSRWSLDSSDRTICDQLKMGKNRVHIANWVRRDNHRWLKVIDAVEKS